jgi:hypothetical protein
MAPNRRTEVELNAMIRRVVAGRLTWNPTPNSS